MAVAADGDNGNGFRYLLQTLSLRPSGRDPAAHRVASSPMPVSWRIAGDCVLLESDESATILDWMVAIETAVANRAFKPGMAVVHDTRRRLRMPAPIEVSQLLRFAVSIARAASIQRWALVTRPGAHYLMPRTAGDLGDAERQPTPELRAFCDFSDALTWARCGEQADLHPGDE